MQFNNAEEVCDRINHLYPEHPVVYLFKGITTYWENYPLIPSSPDRVAFENDMHTCIKLCEKNRNSDYDAENLLANLCSRGLLLLFYADNDLSREVIPLAKSTYQYLRLSFRYTTVCSDFLYFTGIYNYYREAYPRIYPVYKALAFLFPSGDMAAGLKELQIAGVNSIVLRAESYSILSWIYLNFENNYEQALFYSKSLNDQYPDNILYKAMYINNLLLLKRYEEAERIIRSSSEFEKNQYYQAQLQIFNGIIQEKRYHNNFLAREYYKKGIRDLSIFGTYGNEFVAYGYFGLSRISEANGDNHEKRIDRRKATDLVDFKNVNFDD
jgi:tetratricopeptide (TPR) repeat protein